jgi:hypothetical protein
MTVSALSVMGLLLTVTDGRPGVSVMEVTIEPDEMLGRFRVDVVSSPAGEASARVELDVAGLIAHRGEFLRAVLVSAVRTRRALSAEEVIVRGVGQQLFAALLGADEVAGRYRASAAVAAERGHGLRLALRTSDPELVRLPWEAMYDTSTGEYVCRHLQLVRHVAVPSVAAPLPAAAPLRILGIASSPGGLPPLDTGREKTLLMQALASGGAPRRASMAWASSATWASLQDMLLSGQWDVVHFAGHGGQGQIALTHEDGGADLVEASRVVDLLRQARPMPRLVVLSCCSGAAGTAGDLFSATAVTLIRGGVSAVVAMQHEISDPAAVLFTRGFYRAIASGRGVDEAVSSGRVAIMGQGGRTLEWMTPVLYLRGQDAHLFAGAAVPRRIRKRPVLLAGAAALAAMVALLPSWVSTGPRGAAGTPLTPSATPRALIRVPQGGNAEGVAFGPDGRSIAVASGNGITYLWDTATLAITAALGDPGSKAVDGIAFSADGILAAGDYNGNTYLWSSSAGRLLATLREPGNRIVIRVAFSPHGDTLATCDLSQNVYLWDAATGRVTASLPDPRGQVVLRLAFSPDGRVLAASDTAGATDLWDLSTRRVVILQDPDGQDIYGVAFSREGDLLAAAAYDGPTYLWDLGDDKIIATLRDPGSHGTNAVAFSPDGQILAAGDGDGSTYLWNTATSKLLARLRDPDGHDVYSVAFSSDGRTLATTDTAGRTYLWNIKQTT